MGDFNITAPDREKLQNFLGRNYGLRLDEDIKESTNRGGTVIDLTFSRNVASACKPYVCYFSYHRPAFNRITLDGGLGQRIREEI